MYIILLKVYYSFFPAVTACTFDWLIGIRSLVKRKLNHYLLLSMINNKESVDTGAKHRNYSVKVHSEKYSTWYMKYGKYSISLLMPKQTDLCDGARPDSHVTALWTIHIVKNEIYFLPYHFTNINFCHFIHTASIQDLLEKSYV